MRKKKQGNRIYKRTPKEAEEAIKRLQTKLWHSQEVLNEMRMSLYYSKKRMQQAYDEIDGMWFHHQDGSDLLVSQSEMFNVLYNTVLRDKIKKSIDSISKPLGRLREFLD